MTEQPLIESGRLRAALSVERDRAVHQREHAQEAGDEQGLAFWNGFALCIAEVEHHIALLEPDRYARPERRARRWPWQRGRARAGAS